MPRLRRSHRSYVERQYERKTIAVSFRTRKEAEQTARELQILLSDEWDYYSIVATSHSDHGVAVLIREVKNNQPKGETKNVKRQARKRRV